MDSAAPFNMPRSDRKAVKTTCPACGARAGQVRNGHNPSGSQRVLCGNCGRHYTSSPKFAGHSKEKVHRVLRDYALTRLDQLAKKGGDVPLTIPYPSRADAVFRQIARRQKIHHQTVKKWVMQWYESGEPLHRYLGVKPDLLPISSQFATLPPHK